MTLAGKVRYLIYQIQVIIHSFYPLMLNTAKRSRTTVEALEIKGYRYAAVNKEVKKMKLATLKAPTMTCCSWQCHFSGWLSSSLRAPSYRPVWTCMNESGRKKEERCI
mgnify:CR=1 FL=1